MVKEHQELVFISQNGIVQRTGVRGINRYGRTSQGVRVMKLRDGDEVSAVALVVESDTPAAGNGNGSEPVLEAGGETVAVEPVDGDDGDGVVVIEPPAADADPDDADDE